MKTYCRIVVVGVALLICGAMCDSGGELFGTLTATNADEHQKWLLHSGSDLFRLQSGRSLSTYNSDDSYGTIFAADDSSTFQRAVHSTLGKLSPCWTSTFFSYVMLKNTYYTCVLLDAKENTFSLVTVPTGAEAPLFVIVPMRPDQVLTAIVSCHEDRQLVGVRVSDKRNGIDLCVQDITTANITSVVHVPSVSIGSANDGYWYGYGAWSDDETYFTLAQDNSSNTVLISWQPFSSKRGTYRIVTLSQSSQMPSGLFVLNDTHLVAVCSGTGSYDVCTIEMATGLVQLTVGTLPDAHFDWNAISYSPKDHRLFFVAGDTEPVPAYGFTVDTSTFRLVNKTKLPSSPPLCGMRYSIY